MPVVSLARKQSIQIFATFKKDIHLIRVMKFGAGTSKAHTMPSTIYIVVPRNTENPLLRHSRRNLEILKEAFCQLVFLCLPCKGDIAGH